MGWQRGGTYMLYRPAFYKLSRKHSQWSHGLSNQAVEYVGQKGIWLDASILQEAATKSPSAFWEEVAAVHDLEHLKDLHLEHLSYVVDSAESERLWCLFQRADHKGSQRSRLDFKNKEKEVGLMASLLLDKYVRKKGSLDEKRAKKMAKMHEERANKKATRRRLTRKGSNPKEEPPEAPKKVESDDDWQAEDISDTETEEDETSDEDEAGEGAMDTQGGNEVEDQGSSGSSGSSSSSEAGGSDSDAS